MITIILGKDDRKRLTLYNVARENLKNPLARVNYRTVIYNFGLLGIKSMVLNKDSILLISPDDRVFRGNFFHRIDINVLVDVEHLGIEQSLSENRQKLAEREICKIDKNEPKNSEILPNKQMLSEKLTKMFKFGQTTVYPSKEIVNPIFNLSQKFEILPNLYERKNTIMMVTNNEIEVG